MGRKITIVSGKGGVGKTTATLGIGTALAKNGHSVCLVDLDIGLNNLDIMMNIENKIIYDLADCLKGNCRIKEALICDPLIQNLYVMPSAKCDDQSVYDRALVNKLIDRLGDVFDFVIIDAPAGINEYFYLAATSADEAIVVVTPHVSSLRDADKVISAIKGLKRQEVSLLINRIRGDLVASGEMLSHTQIENLIKVPLLGVLPESDDINIYSSLRFDKVATGGMQSAFNILANNLIVDKKQIYDYEAKYKGVLGMIRRSIKRKL